MNPISVQLTENDLLQFYLYWADNSAQHKRARRRHRLLTPGIYLACALFLATSRLYTMALLFALFAVAWYFLSPAWLRRRYRKHYERFIEENAKDVFRAPVMAELRPDGLFTSSALGESTLRYDSIEGVAENDGYTYVIFGATQALVLPHDRIDKETLDLFVNELNQRREAADGRRTATTTS